MKLLNSVKYNLLSLEELIISLDRLSRFKLPEETFPRVFYSIIFKHLIYPKYSQKDILALKPELISSIVEKIWNNSVKEYFKEDIKRDLAYKKLISSINSIFCDIEERTKIFMEANLAITPILKKTEYKNAPNNLKFLIKLVETEYKIPIEELRKKYSFCYPVSKLVIVEGITEEILLPVFAKKLNKDFNKNGIFLIGAGGKSKSPSLYLKMKNRLKIPIILLFDEDAKEICIELEGILLKKDKYIIIEKGEFEDILPLNLIKRTLNKEYLPATLLNIDELRISAKMCDNLENFYKIRHLGEFKKAKFAKLISENIKYDKDISPEINKIISSLI